MTRDIVDQLRSLPPELPDVPDRPQRVRERARRMRRTRLLLVAAATAVAVAVPAGIVGALAARHGDRTLRPSDPLQGIASTCPRPGLTVQALPTSVRMTHTAEQAEAVVSVAGETTVKTLAVVAAMVRVPDAAKLGLGSPATPRPMWVIQQLVTTAPPSSRSAVLPAGRASLLPGMRVAELRLVDDATLRPALTAECAPVSATRGDVGFGIADGTRVAATGAVVPAGTGYVLCRSGGVTAAGGDWVDGWWGGSYCSDQVALSGDRAVLARAPGSEHEVIGVWDHDSVAVTSVGPPRTPAVANLTTPPCPTPAGGWAHVPPSKTPNLDDAALTRYRSAHPGVITSIALFRPAELAPVLTVASIDPAATRAALRGDYPRALCVVRSLFGAGQVAAARRELQRAFDAHLLPGVYGFGFGVSPQGQATLGVTALTDRAELHKALAGVPKNLLVIEAWIRQLGPK